MNDVLAMLTNCAPGHTVKEYTHNICICYHDLTYPALPKGEHGKSNPPIQNGHIKRMARFFGILRCAKDFLSI
jgi:hypothetical protein